MKIERLLLIVIAIMLAFGIIVPIILLINFTDKTIAGQIGDTLGGSTAPFVNISAILIVLVTYLYQRRNDKKKDEKELIFETFQNLRTEFEKITHEVTITSKDRKEVKRYSGSEAVDDLIRTINEGNLKEDEIKEFSYFHSIVNVYQSLNSLFDTVIKNDILSNYEKKLFLAQLSLFYRNNLFVAKDQRGEEICKYHNKFHKLPNEIYNELLEIETKII